VETHLLGKNGVRRYPGDIYCGHGLNPIKGETAEWPLGLAWLAICYAKLADHGRDYNLSRQPIYLDWEERRKYFDRAVHYFMQLEANMTPDGLVPEMYVGGIPGHNTPLAWAQSFHVVAAQNLLNLAHAHPAQFKLPAELRQGKTR
jgi:GH15 family glucan-1,4-alpha-glucosidase